jgi:hypothetical protein
MRLKYVDAEDFDFSNGVGYNKIVFSKLCYTDEQIKEINDIILRGGIK